MWYLSKLDPSPMSIGLLLWTALIDFSCAVPSWYLVEVMVQCLTQPVILSVIGRLCLFVIQGVSQDIIVLLEVRIRVHVPCSILVRRLGPHNRCLATGANMRGPAPHLARTLFRL